MAELRESTRSGQEAEASEGKSNRIWVVDPLDGTTNYVHGFPFFWNEFEVIIMPDQRGMASVRKHRKLKTPLLS